MRIWLDTIDLDIIEDAAEIGLLSGVTTNPSVLSRTSNVKKTLSKILDIQPGPIAVQVTSTDPKEMIEEGLRIFEFSSRTIVKIPIDRNGLIAIKQLHEKQVPVLGTGILFPTQALLASNHKVSYIAPYFSHMKNIGDAFDTLKIMVNILRNNGFSTKILVASLKKLDDILYCASLGVDAVTIKPDLYHNLVADQPLVERISQKFLLDWQRTHGTISIKEALSSLYESSAQCE